MDYRIFNVCTDLMHANAHGAVRTHARESALIVDSGRKIPCRTGGSNLGQWRAGPTLYQLSYILVDSYFHRYHQLSACEI